MSLTRAAQFVLYSAATASLGKTLYTLEYEFLTPIAASYGSHFQFLTYLGLVITAIAQVVGLLWTVSGIGAFKKLKYYLDLLAAPLEVLISALYWGIVSYDRSLVIDTKLAPVPPLWLDLSMHAVPAVVELLDVVAFAPIWKLNTLQAFPLFAAFAAGYWVWVHHTFSKNGFFPYPLLGVLDDNQRAVLFAGSSLFVGGAYAIVRRVQWTLRGKA